MTRIMCVLIAVVLCAGCQPFQDSARAAGGKVFKVRHPIERFENMCASSAFPQLGRCVRSELEKGYPGWRSDPNADLNDVYLAWLDAAGARVADGRMDEPEARLGAAEMKVRLKQISSDRETNKAIRQSIGTTQMLTGLALMESATPRPIQSPAPSQIVCTSGPYNPVYKTYSTVCR